MAQPSHEATPRFELRSKLLRRPAKQPNNYVIRRGKPRFGLRPKSLEAKLLRDLTTELLGEASLALDFVQSRSLRPSGTYLTTELLGEASLALDFVQSPCFAGT